MGVGESKEKKYISRKRNQSMTETTQTRKTHVLETKTSAITDDYTLLTKREIGSGISGKVILCQHKLTKKKYALKKIKDTKCARREIQLQWRAQQNFINIVQIKDVYENKIRSDSYFFIIMEYVEGGELFNRIRNRKNPFTEFEVAKIMKQIIMTVKHLHSMGIAHRDLKPENLLVSTRSGNNFLIKLCDFGFAKEASKGLMTPNYTPYYVAPEILRFEKYDISCDIWSLGVIMYILCCGSPPFYSVNGNKISPGMEDRIKNGIFSFSNKEWVNISKAAKDLIRGMLETVPEKRFSIDDIINSEWLTNYTLLPKTNLESVKIMNKNGDLEEVLQNIDRALNEMRVDWEADIVVKEPNQMDNPLLKRRETKKLLGTAKIADSNIVNQFKNSPKGTPSPKAKKSLDDLNAKNSPKLVEKSNSVPSSSAVSALYYSSNLKGS